MGEIVKKLTKIFSKKGLTDRANGVIIKPERTKGEQKND